MSIDHTVDVKTPYAAATDGLDGDTVSKYLNLNPEFFVVYEDLLPRLRIPHSNGKAVSLIEKQVDVLRGQCSKLENRLSDLISVARQNEALHTRLHVLIQDIISAGSVDDIVRLTRESLLQNFNADDVRIFLRATHFDSDRSAVDLAKASMPDVHAECQNELDLDMGMDLALDLNLDATVVEGFLEADHRPSDSALPASDLGRAQALDNADLAQFKTLFESRQTMCGVLDEAQLSALGCTGEPPMGSAALVPLWHESALGLVLISSDDATRFDSGKGVLFLNQLGELLSRRLHSLSSESTEIDGAASSNADTDQIDVPTRARRRVDRSKSKDANDAVESEQ